MRTMTYFDYAFQFISRWNKINFYLFFYNENIIRLARSLKAHGYRLSHIVTQYKSLLQPDFRIGMRTHIIIEKAISSSTRRPDCSIHQPRNP